IGLLREVKVRSLLDRAATRVAPDTPLAEVRTAFAGTAYGELMVVDSEGVLRGLITYGDLAAVAFKSDPDEGMTAVEICRATPPLLAANDDLEMALRLFRQTGEAHLPVIDNRSDHRLLGLIHEHEVMAAYHRALVQAQGEERAR